MISEEFLVVFTVSFFVGNPVYAMTVIYNMHIYKDYPDIIYWILNKKIYFLRPLSRELMEQTNGSAHAGLDRIGSVVELITVQ